MNRRTFLALVKVVAVLCVLTMLPVINVSAATVAVTAKDGNGVNLATSAGAAAVSPRSGIFTVEATTSANIEVTIMSKKDGSLSTDEIAYINQDNSGAAGKVTYSFTLRDGVPDGTYVVSVGGEGVSAPENRYFKLGGDAQGITINPPLPTVEAGRTINFTGTVTGLSALSVEILNSKNIRLLSGKVVVTGNTYTASMPTTNGFSGTYTVRVYGGALEARGTVTVTPYVATSTQYGDVADKSEAIPNGDVNLTDYTFIMRHYTGDVKLEGQSAINADCNGNGDIDLGDAKKVLQYYNGDIKEEDLPPR